MRQRGYSNYTKISPTINTSLFGEGGGGQGVCCTINSPLEIRAKNRSKNKLVRKNAVTRAHGICSLRVMASWVVLTLHYNDITDKCPVCHLLLIILKSKLESKLSKGRNCFFLSLLGKGEEKAIPEVQESSDTELVAGKIQKF